MRILMSWSFSNVSSNFHLFILYTMYRFRFMSRKWHPDKNDSPEANGMMMKINEAYAAICKSFEDGVNDEGSGDDENDEWEDEDSPFSGMDQEEFMKMMMAAMMRQMGHMPPGVSFSFGPPGGGVPGRRQMTGREQQQEMEKQNRRRKEEKKRRDEEVSSLIKAV